MKKLMIGARVLVVFMLLGVMATVFRAWWGKHTWERWKAQRESKGDVYTFDSLIPPPIPDSENFAKAPIMVGLVTGKGRDPRWQSLERSSMPKLDPLGWKTGDRFNRKAWLDALGKDSIAPVTPLLDALVEASKRPGSRLPVDYPHCEIPALLGMRHAMRLLRTRAMFRMDQGDLDGAAEDTVTCFKIVKHLQTEPSLIVALLDMADAGMVLQPVWEGIADHRWGDSQLQSLQAELSRVDLVANMRHAYEGERIYSVQMFRSIIEGHALAWKTGDEDPGVEQTPSQLPTPFNRWFYWDLLYTDQYHAACHLDAVDPAHHRVFPALANQEADWFEHQWRMPGVILAKIAGPGLNGEILRAARYQAAVDEALVACALERYRLAHGGYPDSLDALRPGFLGHLPPDLITGGPLHYQKAGNGYSLYETGWDGKDDGGVTARDAQNPDQEDPRRGDWVWSAITP